MPISATGDLRTADAGYTLLEALATLMIVGLLSTAVLLSSPGPERRTRDAAEQLAARLALASDESILLNRPVALVVNAEGYGFARLQDDGWRRIETRSPLIFRPWPNGIEYRVEGADGAGQPGGTDGRVLRFDPLGGATPARIVLSGAGARYEIAVSAQGETSVIRRD
ncbi:MAG: GspH/FimT family pseudopilin [Hyphomonadaceae bacterium]|nr:GspH/FimT family pseudopilin [Hyphomonadaceae bacterium]